MQSLTNCMQRLLGKQLLQPNLVALTQTANFEKHSSFEDNNNKFYPIQAHDEERRPAVRIQIFNHYNSFIQVIYEEQVFKT